MLRMTVNPVLVMPRLHVVPEFIDLHPHVFLVLQIFAQAVQATDFLGMHQWQAKLFYGGHEPRSQPFQFVRSHRTPYRLTTTFQVMLLAAVAYVKEGT